MPRRILFSIASLILIASPLAAHAATPAKPKVRAITAFVSINRSNYEAEIARTLEMLHKAQSEFERRGYEVQTIRITTQPFPEYTSGLPKDEAVTLLRKLDSVATREKFSLNVGPAVMRDDDNSAALEILGEALIHTRDTDASAIIASDDGIHWNSIHGVARLIRYLSEHSEHSRATFSFGASAMLAPYTPFFLAPITPAQDTNFHSALKARMWWIGSLPPEKRILKNWCENSRRR